MGTQFEWIKSAGINEAKLKDLLSQCGKVNEIDNEIVSVDVEIQRLLARKKELTAAKELLEKSIVLSPSELFEKPTVEIQQVESVVVEDENISGSVEVTESEITHLHIGVEKQEVIIETKKSENHMTLSIPDGLHPIVKQRDLSEKKSELNIARVFRGTKTERLASFI